MLNMNEIDVLKQELYKMQVPFSKIDLIQIKDGVVVARVYCNSDSMIIKYFQKDDFKREIRNYQLLSGLQIPVLHMISSTESSILLEDVLCSTFYRMGIERDLDDPVVAKLIAKWYKQLHTNGYDYISKHGNDLYSESDIFNPEAIEYIKYHTGTQDCSAWRLITDNFAHMLQTLRKIRMTLNYNDFYYTNLVVSKDNSSAMMFDYNFLGKGYAYSDVRNVLSSLTERAKDAFLCEYGEVDPLEQIVDDVVSVVVTLYFACQREQFPSWAKSTLDIVSTDFTDKVNRMLEQ